MGQLGQSGSYGPTVTTFTGESVTMYEKHLAMRELWANWDKELSQLAHNSLIVPVGP
jgi:hypothetical protein